MWLTLHVCCFFSRQHSILWYRWKIIYTLKPTSSLFAMKQHLRATQRNRFGPPHLSGHDECLLAVLLRSIHCALCEASSHDHELCDEWIHYSSSECRTTSSGSVIYTTEPCFASPPSCSTLRIELFSSSTVIIPLVLTRQTLTNFCSEIHGFVVCNVHVLYGQTQLHTSSTLRKIGHMSCPF